MRQYLYIEQLAELTPWSPTAIRTMMARGDFREGVHYHKPHGRRSRPIFSWVAVREFIEGAAPTVDPCPPDGIPLASGRVVNLNEATANLRRLHR